MTEQEEEREKEIKDLISRIQENPALYSQLLYDRMVDSERLTILCRNAMLDSGADDQIITNEFTDTSETEIGFTEDGYFRIRMPALLPKREWKDRRYISESMSPVISTFFTNHPWTAPIPCTIVFRYGMSVSKRIKDYDNIETKMIIDLLTIYTLPDDGPDYCRTYYCGEKSDEDFTEVYMLSQDQFLMWLDKFNSGRL